MGNNWSYEEFRRVGMTELEIEQKSSVSLDASRSDWHNVQEMVRWGKRLGYDAVEHPDSECVVVSKRARRT